MSLTAKLARLAAPAPPRAPAPKSALSSLIAPRATDDGPLHLVEHAYGPAPELDADSLRALALHAEPLDTARPLYFDTETTGLMGGTGTLAFLLGVADVQAGQTVVTQLHLPAPGLERPMLRWLAERVEQSTVLISFNGKSFDWPLLKSRFIMNRLSPPPERPHVDLLHCARRVFRHQLAELKLSTLERRVLDFHRRGDIDGAQIPAAWFDYLRTGRVATLARVLSHNERDVKSMVDLVQRLLAAWEERHPVLPETALGLATVAWRAGDEARALRFVERATEKGLADAWELKAELQRRRGDYSASVETLQRALEHHEQKAVIHLRLAKLYEHRLRDYERARQHAESCGPAETAEAHAARQRRLATR